jgi:hypothetical protein
VASSPLNPHLASPAELKARIEAERGGRPLMIYRDEHGGQRILELVRDGDIIEVGQTALAFRDPVHRAGASTAVGGAEGMAPALSPAQARVLVALCRPYRDGDQFATPAGNRQIADELHLSVPAVKTHLRTLFQRFGIPDLPHNEKRLALARAAFDSRAMSPSEIDTRRRR